MTGRKDTPIALPAECSPWREALSARIDGELPAADHGGLDDHLAGCESCRAFAGDAEASHRALRLGPAEAVGDRTDAIMAAWDDRQDRDGPSRRHRPARRVGVAALVAAALVVLAGLAGWWPGGGGADAEPALAFASGVATPAPAEGNTAVYVSLTNDGGSDRLLGVDTDVAERATLHATEQRDGLVLMTGRDDYPVPGDTTVVFQPGGAHVMLEGLRRPLEVGDRLEVVLEFERSASRTLMVEVVSLSEVTEVVGIASQLMGPA
ncbi:copper chaperone PCu(A)C [Rhabdothermincola salaria]|uniref:copper chaperone PCu(A)C n=1 Tax=Rhabdothermincola salaria TaxID=2903142 RepID=UPI001E4FEF43|nr:copper chaperone PCu(A)C [Rhabdothermincola salaria]MCD9624705.1 copper chaperone PCu(A)C [Rhabdothermincola salaria]